MAKKKVKTELCLVSGYCFKLDGDASKWKRAADDRWDIEVCSDAEIKGAKYVGQRRIDGTACAVFVRGKSAIAQSLVNIRKC